MNTGPDTAIGHAGPGKLRTKRGHLLHFDFGVLQDDYCSDLQRNWYLLEQGERRPPEEVRHAWKVARGALLAGAEAMRPAAHGWEVDAASRAYMIAQGFSEYMHAFGHHIGRSAHEVPPPSARAGIVMAIQRMAYWKLATASQLNWAFSSRGAVISISKKTYSYQRVVSSG